MSSAQHAAALRGAWAGPPDDAPAPMTCMDRSEHGIYLRDRTAAPALVFGFGSMARLLAAGDDMADELHTLLAERGAVLPRRNRVCPRKGAVIPEDDWIDFHGEPRCPTCGGPLRPMERGE